MSEYAFYFDDSGHPDDQPFLVAAGFISTEEKWLAFEPVWLEALKKYRLGRVFHMTEFERKFRNDPQRGKILEELTGIIASFTTATFSTIVEMAAYRQVNELYPLEEGIGTPWAYVARTVAKFINEWKRLHFKPADRLVTFIEDGMKHRGDMEEVFRRDGIFIPQPVPKSTSAVQTADLLAWEVFHFARFGKRRRSLANLLEANELFEGIGRKDELIGVCKAAKLPLRSSIPNNVVFVYHSSPKRIRKRKIK